MKEVKERLVNKLNRFIEENKKRHNPTTHYEFIRDCIVENRPELTGQLTNLLCLLYAHSYKFYLEVGDDIYLLRRDSECQNKNLPMRHG